MSSAWNRADAVSWMAVHWALPESHILYIVDDLSSRGNDEPVASLQAKTRSVADRTETFLLLEELVRFNGRDVMVEEVWRRNGSEVVYQGRVRLVEYSVENADGVAGRYEVDESLPYAVATLIRVGGEILVSRQYRFPLNQWIYDLPGGAGEESEEPEIAARRELNEELGITNADLVFLQKFYPNPGRSAWPVYLFYADHFQYSRKRLKDPWEEVRAARLPINELSELMLSGELVDPSLLIAVQAARLRGLLP